VGALKIEHLQYFVSLVTSQNPSISKTAEELYISQQQLNRIISSLEEDVNCKLISRSTKGISLTKNGKEFLKYANIILKEYTAMKHYFYLQQNNEQISMDIAIAKVKIALPPTLILYSNEIIKQLKNIAPNISLKIEEKNILPVDKWEETLYFWTGKVSENAHVYRRLDFGKAAIYASYNRENSSKSISSIHNNCLFFPHADMTNVNDEEILLITNNIISLVESVIENDAIFEIPDFCVPKLNEKYPELGFLPTNRSSLSLSVIYPTEYTLTEADKMVIHYIQSYIINLQILAKEIQKNVAP